MITTKRILVLAVFIAAVVAGVKYVRSPKPSMTVEKKQLEVWICPTHKDLKFNTLGKCSMCGAELVKEEQ